MNEISWVRWTILRQIIFSILLFPINGLAAQVSLEESYRAALEHTEIVPINESRIRQADERVNQAIGGLFPKIDLNSTYYRQDDKGPSTSGKEQKTSKVIVNQPLFQGGKEWSGLNVLKLQKLSQEKNTLAARAMLYASVAEKFFDVRTAEQEIANLEDTISLTQERISELKKRLRIGRSRQGEVLAEEAQLAVLQSQLEIARGQLATARDQFALMTGLDRNTKLSGAENLPNQLKKLDYYLKLVEQRPDVEAMRTDLEAAESNVSSARAGHIPTLSLLGNYYLQRTGTNLSRVEWDASLGLTLPIFAGGAVQASIRESLEKEREAELLLSQKRRQAEAEIRSTHSNLRSALEQISTLEKALKATERNYREQTRDYRNSLVTNLDVLQALNIFQDTKRTLDRTRFQAMVAWAQLQAAVAQIP